MEVFFKKIDSIFKAHKGNINAFNRSTFLLDLFSSLVSEGLTKTDDAESIGNYLISKLKLDIKDEYILSKYEYYLINDIVFAYETVIKDTSDKKRKNTVTDAPKPDQTRDTDIYDAEYLEVKQSDFGNLNIDKEFDELIGYKDE